MLGLLNEQVLLFILAFTAGFVDTATFVGADGIFSAHVTGNFVVFASNVFSGKGLAAYGKLLTFPCFALGVLLVGKLQSLNKLKLKMSLVIISLFIFLSAMIIKTQMKDAKFLAAMILVFAMGIQNAAHKIFLKGTPTSTVMTGNVTQFFLEFISPAKSAIYWETIQMISFFLIGCVAGAGATKSWGLTAIVVPAFITLISAILCKEKKQEIK